MAIVRPAPLSGRVAAALARTGGHPRSKFFDLPVAERNIFVLHASELIAQLRMAGVEIKIDDRHGHCRCFPRSLKPKPIPKTGQHMCRQCGLEIVSELHP